MSTAKENIRIFRCFFFSSVLRRCCGRYVATVANARFLSWVEKVYSFSFRLFFLLCDDQCVVWTRCIRFFFAFISTCRPFFRLSFFFSSHFHVVHRQKWILRVQSVHRRKYSFLLLVDFIVFSSHVCVCVCARVHQTKTHVLFRFRKMFHIWSRATYVVHSILIQTRKTKKQTAAEKNGWRRKDERKKLSLTFICVSRVAILLLALRVFARPLSDCNCHRRFFSCCSLLLFV